MSGYAALYFRTIEPVFGHLPVQRHSRPVELFRRFTAVPLRGSQGFEDALLFAFRQALHVLQPSPEILRKIIFGDHLAGSAGKNGFEYILQFANVTWPVVPQKVLKNPIVHACYMPSELVVELVDIVVT